MQVLAVKVDSMSLRGREKTYSRARFNPRGSGCGRGYYSSRNQRTTDGRLICKFA